MSGSKNDTQQVKRIVLACERDMEDGGLVLGCFGLGSQSLEALILLLFGFVLENVVLQFVFLDSPTSRRPFRFMHSEIIMQEGKKFLWA